MNSFLLMQCNPILRYRSVVFVMVFSSCVSDGVPSSGRPRCLSTLNTRRGEPQHFSRRWFSAAKRRRSSPESRKKTTLSPGVFQSSRPELKEEDDPVIWIVSVQVGLVSGQIVIRSKKAGINSLVSSSVRMGHWLDPNSFVENFLFVAKGGAFLSFKKNGEIGLQHLNLAGNGLIKRFCKLKYHK